MSGWRRVCHRQGAARDHGGPARRGQAPHPRGQLLEARRRGRARVARRLSLAHPDSGWRRGCRARLNAAAAFQSRFNAVAPPRRPVPAPAAAGWRPARPRPRAGPAQYRARPVQREGTASHAVRPQVAQRRRHDGHAHAGGHQIHRRRQLRRALADQGIETVLAAGRHDVGAETVAGLARIQNEAFLRQIGRRQPLRRASAWPSGSATINGSSSRWAKARPPSSAKGGRTPRRARPRAAARPGFRCRPGSASFPHPGSAAGTGGSARSRRH